jgi:hypothetical protein
MNSCYLEVLSLAERLSHSEQSQLLEVLTEKVYRPIAVAGADETIPAVDIAQSQAAWLEYVAGRDRGVSAGQLKQLLGVGCG